MIDNRGTKGKEERIAKEKKRLLTLTPEQVAANESMKPGYNTSGINPYPVKKNTPNPKHNMASKGRVKSNSEPMEKSEFEVYTEIGSWKEKTISDKGIDKLALELIEWAKKKTSLKINQFLTLKKIDPRTFARLRKRSFNLQTANDVAILSLGDNREIGAIIKEYDKGMILPMMHRYDPEWKKAEKWHADINTKNQSVLQGVQIVEIPAAEKTDVVPPLKKNKNE